MANISVTNSTYTTGGLDTRDTLDGTSDATFQNMNGAASACVAIETILGDGPTLKGTAADLVARLAVSINAAGTLKLAGFTGLTTAYGLLATSATALTPKNISPVGRMEMYGGSAAPSHWLLCDGSAVSRTTYADLFAVIADVYGVGDGATTFNVPDMRGRIPIGVGTGTGGGASGTGAPSGGSALTAIARSTWKGAETHTLDITEIPSHGGHSTGTSNNLIDSTNAVMTGNVNLGGGGAHNNIQPVMGVNFIIYAGV